MNLDTLQQRVERVRNQYDLARATLKAERKSRAVLQQRLERIVEARRITLIVAQLLQERAHERISRVVTSCLQTVFPNMNCSFEMHFERKRHHTETKLVLLQDGNAITNPMEGESGGVLDVASFALQLTALLLSKPPLRRIMIMDEPFKNVAIEYRANVRQMLEKLAKEFKIQFIIVTHMDELMIGWQVRL
jgi:ABC-type molybdenum transport system ATPase subunit/photorepair protein PhrA